MAMTYTQLEKHVQEFFGDKSRSQSATKRDLNALSDFCLTLAESLDGEDDRVDDDEDENIG